MNSVLPPSVVMTSAPVALNTRLPKPTSLPAPAQPERIPNAALDRDMTAWPTSKGPDIYTQPQSATPGSIIRARAVPEPAPIRTPEKLDLPNPLPTAPILQSDT